MAPKKGFRAFEPKSTRTDSKFVYTTKKDQDLQPKFSLFDVMQASYSGRKNNDARDRLREEGFIQDNELSNHNQKVFYNPEKKKLVVTVAGSHNARDWLVSDVKLALGKALPKPLSFGQDARVKEAKDTLRKAKEKYKPEKTLVAGHSLGGTIASKIGSRDDDIVTLNKGATIGQRNAPNEHAYRLSGDVVSLASKYQKGTTTISARDAPRDPYSAHVLSEANRKPLDKPAFSA